MNQQLPGQQVTFVAEKVDDMLEVRGGTLFILLFDIRDMDIL